VPTFTQNSRHRTDLEIQCICKQNRISNLQDKSRQCHTPFFIPHRGKNLPINKNVPNHTQTNKNNKEYLTHSKLITLIPYKGVGQ
jgi:hypothetical protein